VANPIGSALGLVFPPILVSLSSVSLVLIVYAVFACVTLLIVVFLFKSKPFIPPSYSALEQETISKSEGPSFTDGMGHLVKNVHFLLVFSVYAMNVGAFQSLATLSAQIFGAFDFDAIQSSILSASVVVFGVIGSAVFGKLMDRFRAYRLGLIVCYSTAAYINVVFSATLGPGRFVPVPASAIPPVAFATFSVAFPFSFPLLKPLLINFSGSSRCSSSPLSLAFSFSRRCPSPLPSALKSPTRSQRPPPSVLW
jgi:hypothetical protein